MIIQLRRITSSSHRYIAEVDGLRFVAISSVLLFHTLFMASRGVGASLVPAEHSRLLWPFYEGWRGVELFFVISGFILGLPFAQQFLASGRRVDIRRYFLRRLTRLEPPYIVALLGIYLAAIVLQTPDIKDPQFFPGLWLRLGYGYSVVHGAPATLNGVTWSLEIEVQFYILAPVFARLFKLSAAMRRATFIAFICFLPLLADMIPRSHFTLLGFAQFFLMGFLLADIHSTHVASGWLPSRLYDVLGIGSLVAVALIPETRLFSIFFSWLLGITFVSALRGNWYRRALSYPLVAIIGGMCYSLYLVHLPILSFVAEKVAHRNKPLLATFLRVGGIGLPVALGVGTIYYILLERPCMNPNWPHTLAQRTLSAWSAILGRGAKQPAPNVRSRCD